MKTQIVIRYKWKERGEEKWLFWLKKKLENLGCTVLLLPITDSELLTEGDWIGRIQQTHAISAEDTYFVDHDPGCLTILKYLERLITAKKEDPALLVAGFNSSKIIPPRLADSSPLLGKGGELTLYTSGKNQTPQDVRLVVLYGGSLGRALENSEKLFLKSK